MSDAKELAITVMGDNPGLQAGVYANNYWFQLLVAYVEQRFTGAGKFLEEAAELLPWSKVWRAIQTALETYQDGQNFLAILQAVLSEWVTIGHGGEMTEKQE